MSLLSKALFVFCSVCVIKASQIRLCLIITYSHDVLPVGVWRWCDAGRDRGDGVMPVGVMAMA